MNSNLGFGIYVSVFRCVCKWQVEELLLKRDGFLSGNAGVEGDGACSAGGIEQICFTEATLRFAGGSIGTVIEGEVVAEGVSDSIHREREMGAPEDDAVDEEAVTAVFCFTERAEKVLKIVQKLSGVFLSGFHEWDDARCGNRMDLGGITEATDQVVQPLAVNRGCGRKHVRADVSFRRDPPQTSPPAPCR